MVKLEYIALMIYVTASTAGVLIIKNFFNNVYFKNIFEFVFQLFNLNLICGIFLYVIGFIMWMYVLSRMNLSIAYPVAITLSFLAILVSSILLLKEELTINIMVGSLMCVAGIIFMLK